MKYYTIYKITHRDSGKFYVGRHVTENLDDGYMGSGKLIRWAQERHGLEAFEKEYIKIFYDPYFMFLCEKAIVTEEFCKRKDTYNIAPGGFAGGWSYLNANKLNLYGLNGKTANVKANLDKGRKRIRTPEEREKISRANKGNQYFLGKSHSEEAKRKIGEANSKTQIGENNSQYGTMWITNDQESKKIKKDQEIPDGWRKGRKIK